VRILLLEGNLDDAELVREAVLEIEESRRWRGWVRHIDMVHLERLEDSLAVLAAERFDAALVDAALPDAQGLAPLLSLRAQAPEMPVILLIGDKDDTFAVSAIREGAEDCLLKSEIDCAILARAMRNAVERRRRTAALRYAAQIDLETGLYNRQGLLTAGECDRRLARRLSRSISIVVATLDDACDGGDAGPPAAVEFAAALRLSFPETDLFARLNSRCFAVVSLCGDREEFSASVAALRHRIPVRVGAATAGPSCEGSIEDLLAQAESSLCENGQSEPAALNHARHASV